MGGAGFNEGITYEFRAFEKKIGPALSGVKLWIKHRIRYEGQTAPVFTDWIDVTPALNAGQYTRPLSPIIPLSVWNAPGINGYLGVQEMWFRIEINNCDNVLHPFEFPVSVRMEKTTVNNMPHVKLF